MTVFANFPLCKAPLFNGILLLLVFASCKSPRLSQESRPRADQQNWGDEAVLQTAVRRLLDSSRLASREPGVVGQYAALLRYWYLLASGNGQDVDGGVRMLNFIHQIHLQNGGGKSLWKQAVREAKKTVARLDGISLSPIPDEYK